MARPARHARAGRPGVLWKIHGCDGDAAWLPRGGRAVAEIEQSARARIPR